MFWAFLIMLLKNWGLAENLVSIPRCTRRAAGFVAGYVKQHNAKYRG